MEGFQFATTLDLNMGYYKIRLDAKSKDITNIVTEFCKFQYNVLPMGMLMSGEILQEKFNKFLVCIKLIKAQINDILVLNKGIFAGHVEELRFFLTHP